MGGDKTAEQLEIGIFETIAQLGIALAGFTGVVAAFGRRADGHWSAAEQLQLVSLLQWSLIAAFCALSPGALVFLDIPEETRWQFATAVFAVVHALSLAWFVLRHFTIGLASFRPLDRRTAYCGVPASVIVLMAQLGVAFGPLLPWAQFVYVVALMWVLFVAALSFAYMLLPRP